MTLFDVNTPSGTPIRKLKAGTYLAIWIWHDFNGDSHAIATSFVEEPANVSKGLQHRSAHSLSSTAESARARTFALDGTDDFTISAPLFLPLLRRPVIAVLGHAWTATAWSR
jgi:hypothetical protein